MRKGIDVSTIQKSVDWERVKSDGVEFAIIKAGQGKSELDPHVTLFQDSEFVKHLYGACSAGIQCGAYYYLTATTVEEAEEQADHFISIMNPHKEKITLYAVVDVESKYLPVDKALLTKIVRSFCKKVKDAGYSEAIYTNPDFLTSRLEDVSDIKLWLALWRDKNNLPSFGKYPNIKIWQWGVDSVDGVKGKVDANIEMSKQEKEETPNDFGASEWSFDAVKWSIENKLAVGNENGDMMLKKNITREEMFVLLYRFYKKFIEEGE